MYAVLTTSANPLPPPPPSQKKKICNFLRFYSSSYIVLTYTTEGPNPDDGFKLTTVKFHPSITT